MILFFTALLVVAADQLSKIWVRTNLVPGASIPKTGWFRLTHLSNTGAAFGLFQDQSFALTIFVLASLAILLLLTLFPRHLFPFLRERRNRLALSLVLGGTVGNLIDRLTLGYVTDFIDLGVWPAFNIADSTIVVGITLLVYSFWRLSPAKKHTHGQ